MSHPIKGYVSADPGRRIYYPPANPFYEEASPERSYATEDEARQDGGRPAPRGTPADPRDLVRTLSSPLTIALRPRTADTLRNAGAPAHFRGRGANT